MRYRIAALGSLLIVQGALAQEQFPDMELAEVVVTGYRSSGEDYLTMPAITIKRQADFLVRSVHVTNDTRSEQGRTDEIYQTIKDLLTAAGKQPGFALAYGEEFLIPITASDYKIPLEREGSRADSSFVDIYVKIALGPNVNVSDVTTRLNRFIKEAKVAGRTEVKAQSDLALSVVNPERYRYEIIHKIAQDAAKLRSTVGASCTIEISGLENRVLWQRSDISELTLYIPYEVELSGCQ